MDLLDILKSTAKRFPDGFKSHGIDAVILHIERAEKYWKCAKEQADEIMFTDVIYRTNQAFEGALKEAYLIFANKDPSKSTIYEIERYLEEGKLLKERVFASLTNYRKEWRNTSTHDYKLFFSEQEALLAIASVSTFCIILLEQIITKANERYERERIQSLSNEVLSFIKGYHDLPLEKKVPWLLIKSYEFIDLPSDRPLQEYEYIGLLTGFLEAVDPTLVIEQDVSLGGRPGERADLIISYEDHKVLIEVKRYSSYRFHNDKSEAQVRDYLTKSGIKYGVVMLFDEKAKRGDFSTQQYLFNQIPTVTFVTPISS